MTILKFFRNILTPAKYPLHRPWTQGLTPSPPQLVLEFILPTSGAGTF